MTTNIYEFQESQNCINDNEKAYVIADGNKRILHTKGTDAACVDLDKNTIEIYGNYGLTAWRHQKAFAKLYGFNLDRLTSRKYNPSGDKVLHRNSEMNLPID